MSSSMIVPMLVNRIVDDLNETCIDHIIDEEESRAVTIKAGRFQEDPVNSHIWAAVTGGDFDDPDYVDGIVTLEDMKRIGFFVPPREIGGGEMWWRRGIIRIGAYFINEQLPQTEAMDIAYKFLGRILDRIEEIRVRDLEDDYGEKAQKLFLYANTFYESGGPPASYIWRGKAFWQCLTERP